MTSSRAHLHVVGAGLIGGSAALGAAAAGWTVTIEDVDPEAAGVVRRRLRGARDSSPAAATDLGGDVSTVHVVLVAVPPHLTAQVVAAQLERHLDAMVTDVASVKARPLADLELLGADLTRYVPGHPIAGSELAGSAAARREMFEGRSWVVCPARAASAALTAVLALVRDLGATPVLMEAAEHDAALAVTSHLPQVLASALASVVDDRFGSPAEGAAGRAAEVAGPALLEMTRVAGSPAALWATIAEANAVHLRAAVADLVGVLTPYLTLLADPAEVAAGTARLIERGARGRRLVAGKHAAQPSSRSAASPPPRLGAFGVDDAWTWVDVVVPDRPGALATLFATAARLRVNIEDLRVDHAPHSSSGLVRLAVRAADAERLREAVTT